MINQNRRNFSDGPWAKVHDEIICLTKDDGDKHIGAGVLFVPENINSQDVTSTGHLKVKRVEVCSWSTKTTAKMAAFFFGASKLTIHKGMLDVEAMVGARKAGSVTAILFGKGGSNMRSITNKQAKVFTDRDVAPFKLRIHAYSVKDRLSVEIRLKKCILSINNDLIEKALIKKVGREDTTSETTAKKSDNRFGGFDEEESEDEGEDFPVQEAEVEYPALGGSVPPVASVQIASHQTLAAKLEDAAARGEVFAEFAPQQTLAAKLEDAAIADRNDHYRVYITALERDEEKKDDEMPPMKMTADELFALSDDVAAWA